MSRTSTKQSQDPLGAPAALAASIPADSKREMPAPSKADLVLKKLRTTKGTTLAQLVDLTGWRQHSVRGFLSGIVRKRLGLNLVSEVGKDGTRRYRVINDVADLSP